MRIPYAVKRSSRARAMRLSIRPDGNVVVTAPDFFGAKTIERFVLQHAEWARRKVEETKNRAVIRIAQRDIPSLKKRARSLAAARCAHFTALCGVQFTAISIRAQKSRWGSCSRKGNLSFNYRIAALPPHLADYVIVHELCHLREPNHSPRFWDLVGRFSPDHARLRKELANIVMLFE